MSRYYKLDSIEQVLITFLRCITKYCPPKRHISLKLQLIMVGCQPSGSEILQRSSIRGDEGHDSSMVDEHDADRKTVPMNSPEFWSGANMDHLHVIPNSFILNESTPESTYAKYPGCRSFDCTRIFPHLESTGGQEGKRKIETDGVESGELQYLACFPFYFHVV